MARRRSSKAGAGPEPFTRRQFIVALVLVGSFVCAITAWGSLAPMGSAVVAPGIVSVETHRKAIQHLEGGIVGRIRVKDGDKVRRGDVLVEMRDVSVGANVDRLAGEYFEVIASISRLTAERDGHAQLTFPNDLLRADEDDEDAAKAAMSAQKKLFRTRVRLQKQQQSVIDKKISRLRKERDGLEEQLDALQRQVKLTEQESADASELFKKRLTRKSRVIDVRRDQARLEERRGALTSSMSQTEQQIAEQELKKAELQSSTLAKVVEELRAQQARAHTLSRELVAARDILSRTRVRAPIDGTIVGLQIHSRDGVITPGQTLMEIVPLSDKLVIEARVRPEDIEEIRTGLPANVVLNTLTRRYGKPIKGTLETVSADRLIDKLSGRAFYLVRVGLDVTSIDPKDNKLLAGMSADVFIQTGDRTVVAYLAAPLLRTVARGMREN